MLGQMAISFAAPESISKLEAYAGVHLVGRDAPMMAGQKIFAHAAVSDSRPNQEFYLAFVMRSSLACDGALEHASGIVRRSRYALVASQINSLSEDNPRGTHRGTSQPGIAAARRSFSRKRNGRETVSDHLHMVYDARGGDNAVIVASAHCSHMPSKTRCGARRDAAQRPSGGHWIMDLARGAAWAGTGLRMWAGVNVARDSSFRGFLLYK